MQTSHPHAIVPETKVEPQARKRFVLLSDDEHALLRDKSPEERASWLAQRVHRMTPAERAAAGRRGVRAAGAAVSRRNRR